MGALAAAAGFNACSSSSSSAGSVTMPGGDGGDASQPCGDGVCGSVAEPDSGNGCNFGVCDAGGIFPEPDSGNPCNIGSCVDAGTTNDSGPVGLVPNDSGADQ